MSDLCKNLQTKIDATHCPIPLMARRKLRPKNTSGIPPIKHHISMGCKYRQCCIWTFIWTWKESNGTKTPTNPRAFNLTSDKATRQSQLQVYKAFPAEFRSVGVDHPCSGRWLGCHPGHRHGIWQLIQIKRRLVLLKLGPHFQFRHQIPNGWTDRQLRQVLQGIHAKQWSTEEAKPPLSASTPCPRQLNQGLGDLVPCGSCKLADDLLSLLVLHDGRSAFQHKTCSLEHARGLDCLGQGHGSPMVEWPLQLIPAHKTQWKHPPSTSAWRAAFSLISLFRNCASWGCKARNSGSHRSFWSTPNFSFMPRRCNKWVHGSTKATTQAHHFGKVDADTARNGIQRRRWQDWQMNRVHGCHLKVYRPNKIPQWYLTPYPDLNECHADRLIEPGGDHLRGCYDTQPKKPVELWNRQPNFPSLLAPSRDPKNNLDSNRNPSSVRTAAPLVGSGPHSFWQILVCWDYYSQYMEN